MGEGEGRNFVSGAGGRRGGERAVGPPDYGRPCEHQ